MIKLGYIRLNRRMTENGLVFPALGFGQEGIHSGFTTVNETSPTASPIAISNIPSQEKNNRAHKNFYRL
jgi:hypothetical protein